MRCFIAFGTWRGHGWVQEWKGAKPRRMTTPIGSIEFCGSGRVPRRTGFSAFRLWRAGDRFWCAVRCVSGRSYSLESQDICRRRASIRFIACLGPTNLALLSSRVAKLLFKSAGERECSLCNS